jgi:hypothetical protein
MDRTDLKLCSLVSDDPRYRGGNGSPLTGAGTYFQGLPEADVPQRTMLGMPATNLTIQQFSQYARGEGWDACWYVARSVMLYLVRAIFGM